MIWHYALHAIAALLLVAIGAPLTWAALRARASSPRGRGPVALPTDTTTPLLLIAAGLSYAAAAIHLAVVPEHFAESAPEGIAFGMLALFQVATGALLQVGLSGRSKVAIIAVNLGATLMWLITRTTGLPFISELAFPEAIALRDVAATAFEVGIVAVLLGLPHATARAGRFASIASVSLVPVLGLVGISTLLAVAGPAPVH
ncbi:MAG: hypothetical protein M3R54_03000 [Chloroflexota bacterium]|nr:hypothetical protein [Chloroflexota bacterium]